MKLTKRECEDRAILCTKVLEFIETVDLEKAWLKESINTSKEKWSVLSKSRTNEVYNKVTTNKISQQSHRDMYKSRNLDICKLYFVDGLKTKQLVSIYKISTTTICNILRKFVRLQLRNKNPHFESCWNLKDHKKLTSSQFSSTVWS